MSEKRRGLGRGLGALIPSAAPTKSSGERPVDVFFPDKSEAAEANGTARGGLATATLLAAPPAESAEEQSGAGETIPPQGSPAEPQTSPIEPEVSSAEPQAQQAHPEALRPEPQTPSPAQPDLVPVPGVTFAEIPVGSIRANPRQPRQIFDEEALAELVHSIREVGVLQPVVVRPAEAQDGAPQYELIMGERRWRATQEAGLDTIPAIIRETSDDDLLRDALLENLHRSQLNSLEEAAAYQQLLDDFGCTHEELATRIGRSRPQISNTIRLLKLPPLVQRRVAAGVLSAGHARALLGLDDAPSMEALAQRIVSEGLSVRAVEEVVALGDAPTGKPVKKRPRAGGHHSELDDLAARLADRLDTRVSVALGRNRGRLSIDFASVEDLNRIIGLLSPDVRGAFSST